MLQTKISIAFFVSFFVSTSTFASGSYSSGGSSYGSSYGSVQEETVDQAYENGKSIYTGRSSATAVRYCIMKDGESVKVKKSSIKQLAGTTYENVSTSLHDCSNPSMKMSDILDGYQVNSVAYYLNKRYKLKLVG